MDNLYQMTDAQLSEAFAVEVLGRYVAPNGCVYPSKEKHEADPLAGGYPLPCFSESLNSVMPWLEKKAEIVILRNQRTALRWFISINESAQAEADDLARAACIALIKAKRAEKGNK